MPTALAETFPFGGSSLRPARLALVPDALDLAAGGRLTSAIAHRDTP